MITTLLHELLKCIGIFHCCMFSTELVHMIHKTGHHWKHWEHIHKIYMGCWGFELAIFAIDLGVSTVSYLLM